MVVLGKAVSLVADILEKPQSVGAAAHPEWFVGLGQIDLFFPFGEGENRGRRDLLISKCCERGGELPLAAIDQQDIRKNFILIREAAVTAGDDLVDAAEVVDTLDAVYFVASVAWLEGQAIEKLNDARYRFAAAKMGNIDAFDRAGHFRQLEHLFEAGKPLLGIDVKDFRLSVGIDLAGRSSFSSSVISSRNFAAFSNWRPFEAVCISSCICASSLSFLPSRNITRRSISRL